MATGPASSDPQPDRWRDALNVLMRSQGDVWSIPMSEIPLILCQLVSLQAAIAARLVGERTAAAEGIGAEKDEPLALQEVATLLKKSTSWVRRAVRRGELGFARRVGRTLLFPRDHVRRYLEEAAAWDDPPPSKVKASRDGKTSGGWRTASPREGRRAR